MTAFVDCLKSALDAGKILPQKFADAETAYNTEIANGIANGLTPEAAADAATIAAVDAMGKYTAAQKWKKINEIRRSHELYQEIMGTKDFTKTLERVADRLEITYDVERGKAMSYFAGMIDTYRPRYGGIIHPVKNLDNVTRATYGVAVNDPGAVGFAREIADTLEYLRESANAKGASIPVNPNKRTPQQHDWMKVRQFAPQTWIDDHLHSLDWSLMEHNGKPIPVADRQAHLQRTYDSIISQGNSRVVPGVPTGKSMLSRMGRERFLYYASADDYLKMQDKYGSGNTFQQMIAAIDSMSRDIAQLKVLGPEPAHMLSFIERSTQARAGQLDIAAGPTQKRSYESRRADAMNTLEESYKIFTGKVLNGEESPMVQGITSTRTLVNTAVMHAVFVANLGDTGFIKYGAYASKTPMTGLIRETIRNFIPNKENRMAAMRSALLAESATGMAASYQRYFGALEGSALARRISDVYMRMGLMTPWTQATRWTWGMHFMGDMADNAGKKFDDLPWKEAWEEEGITAADWDHFRTTPLYTKKGATFLRPMDLANAGGAATKRNHDVADKILGFIHQSGRIAVPQVNLRTRVALGHASPATTARGQLVRTITSLKSFGATVMLQHMRGIIQKATFWEKLKHAAVLFTLTTGVGAFVTQLKELIAGRDPKNMLDWKFWVQAAVNGGSFGLLGDLTYNSLNGNPGSTFGPIGDFAKQASKVTVGNIIEFLHGEDTHAAKEIAAMAGRFVPNIWPLKLATQRMIFDQLLEEADPAAMARIRRTAAKREMETGQGQWWAPGNASPQRGPNFGAIIGK